MQRRRTDAIINGDTLEARRINRMMQDVRAKGTYDAYADLLFNEQQVSLFSKLIANLFVACFLWSPLKICSTKIK